MIFIDANIFLAYWNTQDVHHKKAVVLWGQIVSGVYGECFTSDYVFNEIVGVALRKLGKEKTILLGDHILKSMLIINIDDYVLQRAWTFFTKTKLALSLVDCTNLIVLEMAQTKDIATLDKEFTKISHVNIVPAV